MQPRDDQSDDDPVDSSHNHDDAEPNQVSGSVHGRSAGFTRTEQRERCGKHETHPKTNASGAHANSPESVALSYLPQPRDSQRHPDTDDNETSDHPKKVTRRRNIGPSQHGRQPHNEEPAGDPPGTCGRDVPQNSQSSLRTSSCMLIRNGTVRNTAGGDANRGGIDCIND